MYAPQNILAKARENLQAAKLCRKNALNNAVTSRAYYACLQAATATLIEHDQLPIRLNHKTIHENFLRLCQQFTRKTDRDPNPRLASLPTQLNKLMTYREQADYKDHNIVPKEAEDCSQIANDFVSQLLTLLQRK
jgi:uncharacterized protein (UPF0332 family)